MYGNYGNQITWSHKRVSPGGKGSAAGGEKGVAGMGQCLRYQIHWEDLEEYQALTFLTRNEILCIHDTFLKLCPPGKYYKEATLTTDQVSSLPALRANPFRDRICRVFSHDDVFSFEDVLGMASVFSEQACPSLKIEYAFRIYDFNENGFIDEEDLQRIVLRLLNSDDVSEDLLADLTSHVLNESDLDNDNMLSFSEFEHAMNKAPDFMKYARRSRGQRVYEEKTTAFQALVQHQVLLRDGRHICELLPTPTGLQH